VINNVHESQKSKDQGNNSIFRPGKHVGVNREKEKI
jgi:hypothetical protein